MVNADITEMKFLERRLFGAQRMETIGRLASGIAHDLANALTPVRMAARVLRERTWDKETTPVIESLNGGTAYASSLITQLLSFGKGSEEERISVQPGYLIKEFVRVVRSAFPKSIEIKTEIEPDVWTIHANVTNLHQLVMNICMNACDAMPQGGTLTIAVKNVALKPSPSNYVCIRFSDNGPGIPPHIKNRIMDPFFTTKEEESGMGLGLFIVSRIVKEHNGFIEVTSELGKDTHFEIYLPASN